MMVDGEIEEDTGAAQIPGKEAKREFKQFDGRDKMQQLWAPLETSLHHPRLVREDR